MFEKKIYINDLEQNLSFSDIFIISKKSPIKLDRNGNEFVNFTLTDKTGDIDARKFSNGIISIEEKNITIGDVCRVKGITNVFNGNLNVHIKKIEKCLDEAINLEELEKPSKIDSDECRDFLFKRIEEIENLDYKNLLKTIFKDQDILERFLRAPAAISFHHDYKNGLLEHTIEVIKISDSVSSIYSEIDQDLLVTGAILHDIGKIYSYNYDSEYGISEEGILLDHIYLSAEITKKKSENILIQKQDLNKLLHLILSHHGDVSNGWGSAINPHLIEAVILHHADNLSSKVNHSINRLEF